MISKLHIREAAKCGGLDVPEEHQKFIVVAVNKI